jgi:hypothetical protein
MGRGDSAIGALTALARNLREPRGYLTRPRYDCKTDKLTSAAWTCGAPVT